VRPEVEIELDLYRSARSRPHEADRIAVAANRRIAVQRPRDRLEDGRLPRAVGTDDARETGSEAELGPGVLAEVGEAEAVDPHTDASSTAGPATVSASRR